MELKSRSPLPSTSRSFCDLWGTAKVYSIDDIDISEVLRRERLSYLTTPVGERGNYAREYEPRGIGELAKASNVSRFSLLIVLLQDDVGRILAYTCLNVDDLASLAGQ